MRGINVGPPPRQGVILITSAQSSPVQSSISLRDGFEQVFSQYTSREQRLLDARLEASSNPI